MKLTRVSLIAPIIMLMAACSDDAPRGGAPTEDYVRAFVKEFGVPAKGHDFSMARSAGLKVKASRPTHITVTAEIEGEEYLFGDLNVPAGLTAIPVTIPSDVTSLNLHINGETYRVPSDGEADLDNLTYSDSRTIYLGGQSIDDPIFSEKADGNPILMLPKGWLKDYFEKYRVGENDMSCQEEIVRQGLHTILTNETVVSVNQNMASSTAEAESNAACYYVFPIYWHENSTGDKDYRMKVFNRTITSECKPEFLDDTHPLGFENQSSEIPFPKLGATSREVDYTDPSNYLNASLFDYAGEDASEAYSSKNVADYTIISEGHIIKHMARGKRYIAFNLYNESRNPGMSSSSASACQYVWGDNYFKTDLEHINSAYSGTRRLYLGDVTLPFYNPNTKSLDWIDSRNAFILGFTSAPLTPNDKSLRDYADVVLLVLPTNNIDTYFTYDGMRRFKPYYWTIAAEDLGGSFDWDFNDAVFKFTDVIHNLADVNYTLNDHEIYTTPDLQNVRRIEVEPLAAGGTMPLYITYTGKVYADIELPSGGDADYYETNEAIKKHLSQDVAEGTYVIGTEFHKWLGASTHTKQINTGATVEVAPGQKISFLIPVNSIPQNQQTTVTSDMSSANLPLMGFSVLVDKENSLNIDTRDGDGFVALPEYELGKGSYLIGRPDESKDNIAPQMILIAGDTWEWPQECVNIKDAYPWFSGWVTFGYDAFTWYKRQEMNPAIRTVTKRN